MVVLAFYDVLSDLLMNRCCTQSDRFLRMAIYVSLAVGPYSWVILLLLQPALQPLWVLACSTIIEYSQQEGFYRLPLPAARQTPNLEDQ